MRQATTMSIARQFSSRCASASWRSSKQQPLECRFSRRGILLAGQHRIDLDGTEVLLALRRHERDLCEPHRELRLARRASWSGGHGQVVLAGRLAAVEVIEEIATLLAHA